MKQIKGQNLKPYKLPKLYNAGGDLKAKWFVFYSYKNEDTGKYERFKVFTGLNSLKTKKERNEQATYLITSITRLLESGFDPFRLSNDQTVGEVNTLAQAIPSYMSVKESQLRGKTVTGYRSILKQFKEWAEASNYLHKPLRELKPDEVQDYFSKARKERNLGATTHNTELTTIRSFFTYWQKKGKVIINPAIEIKRLREEVTSHVIYTDGQIKVITDYLIGQDTPKATQLLKYIRFLYYTCIRPKEIRMLKVGDIRLQTDTILVPAPTSKNGRAEPIDITPGLLELINSMNLDFTKTDWYIFGNQARGVAGDYNDYKPGIKPVGTNYFSEYYREVLTELGFTEEYTLYGWKHTRNVHLWLQTKDLLRLMRHNRHTDPKVTMRYLRGLGLLIDTRLDDERRI